MRPLGLGSTNSRAPWTVAFWNPGLITGPPPPGLRRAKCSLLQDPPERAIHRHADERHDLGAKAFDLLLENLPAFLVFVRRQGVDPRRRPRDQVGHPDPPLRQPHVVLVRDRLGDDAPGVEESPEAIGRSGEVMAGCRRHDAGIDSDEYHADARLDRVGQSKIGPCGLRICTHELAVQGRTVELQLRCARPRRQDVVDRRPKPRRPAQPAQHQEGRQDLLLSHREREVGDRHLPRRRRTPTPTPPTRPASCSPWTWNR